MDKVTTLQDESAIRLRYSRRHLRFGWWSLLAFTGLGMALDLLHGFKSQSYLDVGNQTRRLMWTLAHAHGTLIAVVNVIFGLCLRVMSEFSGRNLRLISWTLIASSIALPASFFLGGIAFYGGDPGIGGLFVPMGATLLLVALFLIARAASSLDLPMDSAPNRQVNSPQKSRGTVGTKR